jgi:hypothetical protein
MHVADLQELGGELILDGVILVARGGLDTNAPSELHPHDRPQFANVPVSPTYHRPQSLQLRSAQCS